MDSYSKAADRDRALASAAGSAEPRAQRLVAERLFDRVRATVHYLVAYDSEADDLVQLTMVEILRSLDSFQGRSRLETWADRITIRSCMRALRHRRRQEQNQLLVAEREGSEAAPGGSRAWSSQEQEAARAQLRHRLAIKLQKLTPQRRVVVVLRYVHGYSIKEIARITEAPPNTVRDRLQVGKRQLRGLILKDPELRDWAGTLNR